MLEVLELSSIIILFLMLYLCITIKDYKHYSLIFSTVSEAYHELMSARQQFFYAQSIENLELKSQVLEEAKERYEKAYAILEDAETQDLVKQIPGELQGKFLEMLKAKDNYTLI